MANIINSFFWVQSKSLFNISVRCSNIIDTNKSNLFIIINSLYYGGHCFRTYLPITPTVNHLKIFIGMNDVLFYLF